jgi:hypothetical protein
MCWIYDTGEQPVHFEGISKATLLDGLIYPLIAIRAVSKSKNGRICNEINGGNVARTEISAINTHQEQAPEKQSA